MSCCKHYNSNSGCCYQCRQCDICHRHICVNFKSCCCYSRGWENYFSQKRIYEEQKRKEIEERARKREEQCILEDKIYLCEDMINGARILRLILKEGYEINKVSMEEYRDIIHRLRKLTERIDPSCDQRSLNFPEDELKTGKWKLY